MKVSRTLVRVTTALLATVTALHAHDFWLEPSATSARKGDSIEVGLRLFDAGKIDVVKRKNERITRFVVVDTEGERELAGDDGANPAASFDARVDGASVLAYRSERSRITLEPEKFAAYLEEIGAEHVAKERAERGETDRPAREVYSRSAKALVLIGGSSAGFDRRVGLTLEIVPVTDPCAWTPGQSFTVQLLRDGEPVVDQSIGVHRLDGTVPSRATRTDEDGRATFEMPTAGRWMIHATSIARADAAADAEWESIWASLTFELPAPKDDPK
jgi:uncharacterized GH25 family protein